MSQKCKDCIEFWQRQSFKNRLSKKGYCSLDNQKVNADDNCRFNEDNSSKIKAGVIESNNFNIDYLTFFL